MYAYNVPFFATQHVKLRSPLYCQGPPHTEARSTSMTVLMRFNFQHRNSIRPTNKAITLLYTNILIPSTSSEYHQLDLANKWTKRILVTFSTTRGTHSRSHQNKAVALETSLPLLRNLSHSRSLAPVIVVV